ncbi:MAG: molybdopterin-binding protein [Methylocystis sp.]
MAGEAEAVTAAILVIGDEILSGRTQDQNSHYIAKYLADIGVDTREIRVVPDVEAEIVAAVNALRARYAYVFTTGGIGPTHDDITADAIACAFGVGIEEDPRAINMLLERIRPDQLNEARRRMARIPLGADLIENSVSKAPGFMIGNVIVMAGVPMIMRTMLDAAAPRLRTGARVLVETIEADAIPEGRYAKDLAALAARFEEVSIGSYPQFSSAGVRNQIVLRARDASKLGAAAAATREMISRLTDNGAKV